MKNTDAQYQEIIANCRRLFEKKIQDYGPSWRIMRMPTITDQIYIKAERIRSIQEKKANLVGDSIESEFVGIINYSVIALILLELHQQSQAKQNEVYNDPEALNKLYDQMVDLAFTTMQRKNHDYGEAWRNMRVTSITDLILVKLLRIKQIEDNEGQTLVSEGVEANYVDILNYSVFSLIRLNPA